MNSLLSSKSQYLVVITNEFAIIIEVTRLSCDGLVIIAQPDCNFEPCLNLVDPSVLPAFPHYCKLLVEN